MMLKLRRAVVALATAGELVSRAEAPRLQVQHPGPGQVRLQWEQAQGAILQQTESLSSPVVWEAVSQSPRVEGSLAVVGLSADASARYYRLLIPAGVGLTTISASPDRGEDGVSAQRETILFFSRALAADTLLRTNQFYARSGERRLLTRLELASDRRKATLFYLEPLPAGARVTVVFDGTAVRDELGAAVDADGDGEPGGVLLTHFDTANRVVIPGTAIQGRVFASEPAPDPQAPGRFVNRPLQGVIVTVDGAEETLRATTDAEGRFTLTPAPAGRVFVHLDGRDAVGSYWPAGAYYPFVGKRWEVLPGRSDNLAGGTGEVFLPLIKAGTLQPVNATQETVVPFPPSVLADNPDYAGVRITVPAGALFDDNGTRGGRVGLAPVPPDRLPGPLPPGLNLPLVITVQTDGPLNFDRPAPVCFPNVPDASGIVLPPGAKCALMSFDHDLGDWRRTGRMTVSDDGRLICSDPGSGILEPGWHGSQFPDPEEHPGLPPPPPPGPQCTPKPQNAAAKTGRAARLASMGLKAGDPGDAGGCDSDEDPAPGPKPPCDIADCEIQYDVDRMNCRRQWFQCMRDGRNLRGAALRDHVFWCDANALACREDATFNLNECSAVCSPPGVQRAKLGGAVEDPIELEIEARLAAAVDLIRPYFGTADAPPDELGQQFEALVVEADLVGGGSAAVYFQGRLTALEALNVAKRGKAGEWRGDQPNRPLHLAYEYAYERVFYDDCPTLPTRVVVESGIRVGRLMTAPRAQYTIFLPGMSLAQSQSIPPCSMSARETSELIRVVVFDPVTRSVGYAFPRRIAGLASGISGFKLFPLAPTAPDADADGLPDEAEFVVGTDPQNPDSDGDGERDGAELDLGMDPLGGKPAATGIVATAPLVGTAVDVAAFDELAVVALGENGVAVLEVVEPFSPVLLGVVDTPGRARAVALDRNRAAVGDGLGGAVILSLRDAGGPQLRHQIGLGGEVMAVAAGGGFGFFGTATGTIAVIDLVNGLIVQQIAVAGRVEDLALAGDHLFVARAAELSVYRWGGLVLEPAGSVAYGFSFTHDPVVGRRRVSVAGEVAYVTAYPGYGTFDVSHPAAPVPLAPPVDFAPNSFKQLVPNGSGLGLAVVGATPGNLDPATHNLQLWDLRDPSQTSNVLTQLLTPGLAYGAILYAGLGYVADGQAGFHVVNYLASDPGTNAPQITLRTSFTGDLAEEGKPARLTADVTDDVQVRLVEFLVDGVRYAVDGNAPFEVYFITPALGPGKSAFSVRARAVDTGGNDAWSQEHWFTLTEDATPPRVNPLIPVPGGVAVSPVQFGVRFNEPIHPESLVRERYRLRSAGADRVLDTEDDALVAGGAVDLRADRRMGYLVLEAPLPSGLYRVELLAGVRDDAGNPTASVTRWEFQAVDGDADTDQDGMPDAFEQANGFDRLTADANVDADGDGASNLAELLMGSHPRQPQSLVAGLQDGAVDSDLDRLPDAREVLVGTSPWRADSDGDGWNDEAEATVRSNPLDRDQRPLPAVVATPSLRGLRPESVPTASGAGTVLATSALRGLRPSFTEAGAGATIADPPIRFDPVQP